VARGSLTPSRTVEPSRVWGSGVSVTSVGGTLLPNIPPEFPRSPPRESPGKCSGADFPLFSEFPLRPRIDIFPFLLARSGTPSPDQKGFTKPVLTGSTFGLHGQRRMIGEPRCVPGIPFPELRAFYQLRGVGIRPPLTCPRRGTSGFRGRPGPYPSSRKQKPRKRATDNPPSPIYPPQRGSGVGAGTTSE